MKHLQNTHGISCCTGGISKTIPLPPAADAAS